MQLVLLVIHLLISVALVITILLQRSEGGALGIGGGGSGGFMTARGAANLLTRATSILAAAFLVMSLLLALLAGGKRESGSLMDALPATKTETPSIDLPEVPAMPDAQKSDETQPAQPEPQPEQK